MSHDPLIEKHESAAVEEQRARRAANLFDLRRIIGALFAVYGLILLILGIGASDAEIDKAAGWNLNLWTGLAMLAVAALFLIWAFTRPLADELEDAERELSEGSEAAGRQTGSEGSEAAGRRTGGDGH